MGSREEDGSVQSSDRTRGNLFQPQRLCDSALQMGSLPQQPCYFDLHHLKGWVYSKILKEEDRSGFCYILDSLDRYDGTQNMMIIYQLLLTVKHSGSTAEKYIFLNMMWVYANGNILHLGIIVIINTYVKEMLILANRLSYEMF